MARPDLEVLTIQDLAMVMGGEDDPAVKKAKWWTNADGDGLRFEMLPVPTNDNVLAILDRIMRRIARRLAKDAAIDSVDDNAVPDVLAQIKAEAASTWRSPSDASVSVRGAERLRAWCEGFPCTPAS
jgi:hypothetical protein